MMVAHQVFLEPGQHLGQDKVVVALEALQFGEPGDEEPCAGGHSV